MTTNILHPCPCSFFHFLVIELWKFTSSDKIPSAYVCKLWMIEWDEWMNSRLIGHLHGKCIDSPELPLLKVRWIIVLKWFHPKNWPCFLNDNFSCIGRRWWTMVGIMSLGRLRKSKDNRICSCYLKNWGGSSIHHIIRTKLSFRVNLRMSYERVNIFHSRGRKSKEWKKADYGDTYMYICRWVGVCVCQNVCNIPHKKGGGGGHVSIP